MYFNESELKIIESLVYDPTLKPGYEMIKGCLIWADERADGLTPSGYEKLCDLWIARSFIHRGLPFSSYTLAPDYFEKVWTSAIAAGFKWPGFNRLKLSEEDRRYYEECESETEY